MSAAISGYAVLAVKGSDCLDASGSVVEDRKLEPSQAFGIGDQVHLEDPIPAYRQDAHPEQPAARCHDHPDSPVDEGGLHEL